MKFNNTLFRCSSLGHIMTNPRTGSGLSEGCKTHLIDVYVANKYKRRSEINTRYMEKGNLVEEDSITLISRHKKIFLKKNEEHLSNNWIKGTPDIYEGESIRNATKITDAKSSWDVYTFSRAIAKDELNPLYYWQVQGYMDLTGAERAAVTYCLNNTPAHLIDSEKRKLQWQMGVIDPSTDKDFAEACKEIEKNFIYDIDSFIKANRGYDLNYSVEEWKDLGLDIPIGERIFEFNVERNDSDIMKMHARVEQCREWLNNHESKKVINKPELLII